jgi:hypothetical protein
MTADEKSAYAHTFPVHVGVDTGKSFHKLVARGTDGRRPGSKRLQEDRKEGRLHRQAKRPPRCQISRR